MKTVLLQLTNQTLRLTLVKNNGSRNLFGIPSEYELPDKLKKGGALSDISYLATFVSNSIQNTEYGGNQFIFCLESGQMVTKEYLHLPIKDHDELLQVARLEAETVLHNDVSDYVVTTTTSGHVDNVTGKERSVLYAVPKSLVRNILREFGQRGIKITKIMPPLAGLISSCKTVLLMDPKNPLYQNKTVAVIDVSYEKSRIVVFNSGAPIFQKEFDSVYEEIVDILHKSEDISTADAAKKMKTGDFLLTYGKDQFSSETVKHISMLIDASVGEILRNIRAVLSVERLEIDRVIFCGAIPSHPDFNKFIESRAMGIPFENLTCGPQKLGVVLDSRTANAGIHASDFFTLNGMLSMKGTDCVDFLYEENSHKDSLRRYVTATLIFVAVLAVIGLTQLIVKQTLTSQLQTDKSMLNTQQVLHVKELISEQTKINSDIKQAKQDKKNMPYQKSNSEKILAEILKEFKPNVTKITKYDIDNSVGTAALEFDVSNIDSFNAVRKSVQAASYFTVLVPFEIKSENKGSTNSAAITSYTCSTTLQAKNFTPLKIVKGTAAAETSSVSSPAPVD